jgi:hypothetical protein
MLESVLFFADTVGFFAMKSQEAANLRSFHFALSLELTRCSNNFCLARPRCLVMMSVTLCGQDDGESIQAAAHDDTHDAFMTLPAYTRTREGEACQLGSGPKPYL